MNKKEQEFKNKMSKNLDIIDNAIKIAKELSGNKKPKELSYMEEEVKRIYDIYEDTINIINKPEVLRTKDDNIYLNHIIEDTPESLVSREEFENNVKLILHDIDTNMYLLKQEVERVENESELDSIYFNINLFDHIKDKLKNLEYNEYNQSLYCLFYMLMIM